MIQYSCPRDYSWITNGLWSLSQLLGLLCSYFFSTFQKEVVHIHNTTKAKRGSVDSKDPTLLRPRTKHTSPRSLTLLCNGVRHKKKGTRESAWLRFGEAHHIRRSSTLVQHTSIRITSCSPTSARLCRQCPHVIAGQRLGLRHWPPRYQRNSIPNRRPPICGAASKCSKHIFSRKHPTFLCPKNSEEMFKYKPEFSWSLLCAAVAHVADSEWLV